MSKANKNLKNQAYDALKARLINCIYPPGSFINETQLASELGFSRTPIREAISRLEYDDLITVMPKKGIYVKELSLHDVMQIFQTRLEIEPIALRMAADMLPEDELRSFRERFTVGDMDIHNSYLLDTAMHLFIIEHCGNKYLIDMMNKVFEANTRVIISSRQNQVQIHDARNEHIEILDALLAGDKKNAAELMKAHIENCRQAAITYFCSLPANQTAPSFGYKRMLSEFSGK